MFAPLNATARENELRCVVLKEPLKAVPMHWHDEYELAYAESGDFSILVEGTEYRITEGNVILIPGGEKHFYYADDRCQVTIAIFSVPVKGERLLDRLSEMDRTTLGWNDQDRDYIRQMVHQIEIGAACRDPLVNEIKTISGIYSVLACFADDSVNSRADAHRVEKDRIMERIEVVLKHIAENYSNEISLPAAAGIAGYVPTYFSRVFKEATGLTFYDYLTSYRIAMAERLLLDKEARSIVEIAALSGFGSVKTFDRVFKERKGISPLRYRKKGLSAR